MESVNPATGETIDTYERDDAAAVEAALGRAADAFTDWRERPLADRERLLTAAAEELRANTDEYAELMTAEMGKPISQARSEVEKCAWVCEHYAEYAGTYLHDERYPSPPGVDARTSYEPLGPVLAVMPWNYPFWQVFRFAAPALAAGNVGLLKHAPEVPGVARAIEQVFDRAGAPEGAFQSLLIGVEPIHETILPDDRVAAATVTGSTRAGQAVAATAGEQLKKTVLELGGSDPLIVLEDADVEAAAETAVQARLQNTGQSCIAAKRLLVHEDVYEEFLDAFLAGVDETMMADPTDPETDLGPLVSERHRNRLHEQVTASAEAGATVERGGEVPDRPGAFYPPTVLTDVPEGCPVDAEETFGPAAAVYAVPDADAAVAKANTTQYGLGASVWTADRDRGRAIADRIEAGNVFVNELVKSDPRVPFGGIKGSGYGRELAAAGIREFLNRKTVWIQ